MVRRVTPLQYRSMVRQAQAKHRQAISKHNQEVRRRNREFKHAVDKYNWALRDYKSEVRRNRQRIESALRRLGQTSSRQHYTVLHRSTVTLDQSFTVLERSVPFGESDPRYRLAVALPEQENANNLAVTSALMADDAEELDDEAFDNDDKQDLQDTRIGNELKTIATDLHNRWMGAVFALNPANPDAARHFCSSIREIFTQILHTRAPDGAVLAALPQAALDQRGAPTRRSRIQYLLHKKGMQIAALEDFVEKNIDNVIDLFDVFNEGTHGEAGRFDIVQLRAVKRRVEDAILFVADIAV